ELGLVWPRIVAPADVHIVVAGKDAAAFETGADIAAQLSEHGVEVLLDDRKASPGVKFADAELIGVPTIVIVGKGLAHGVVEVKDRSTGVRDDLALEDVVPRLRRVLAAEDTA